MYSIQYNTIKLYIYCIYCKNRHKSTLKLKWSQKYYILSLSYFLKQIIGEKFVNVTGLVAVLQVFGYLRTGAGQGLNWSVWFC